MNYLENDHSITGVYFVDLLRQLREKIKQIRRGKLTRAVFFHQDNASADSSTVATATIQKCGFHLVEEPPDRSPSDYYLFPQMKKNLRGYHFARDDDVMNAVDHFLRDFRSRKYFCHGFLPKYYSTYPHLAKVAVPLVTCENAEKLTDPIVVGYSPAEVAHGYCYGNKL